MNTKPDPLLERLAAMSPDFVEFETGAAAISEICAQVFPVMARHQKAAEQVTARLKQGKDIDSEIAVVRDCVSVYPAKFRTLAQECLRLADIAEKIQFGFNQLGKPETK